jgi:hypothetical protein
LLIKTKQSSLHMTPKNRISSAFQQHLNKRNTVLFEELYRNRFVHNVDMSNYFCQKMSNIFRYYSNNNVSVDFFYQFVSKLMKKVSNEIALLELLESYQLSVVLPAVHYWLSVKTPNNDFKYWKILNQPTPSNLCESLVVFLFEKYTVPAPLRNIWFCSQYDDDLILSVTTGFREIKPGFQNYSDMVTFHWYFLVAEGGVLRKDEYLPFAMSKNAAGLFNESAEQWSLMQSFRWAKTKGMGANDMISELFAIELPFFDKNEDLIDELLFLVMRSEETERVKIKEVLRFMKVAAFNVFCYEFSGLQSYFLSNILQNIDLKGKNINSLLRLQEELIAELPSLELYFVCNIDWKDFETEKVVPIDFRNFKGEFILFSENTAQNYRIWNLHLQKSEKITEVVKQLISATPIEEILFRLNVLMLLQDVPIPKYEALPNVPDVFEYENSDLAQLEIVRLTDYRELYNEGKTMNHCVANYDSAYLNGHCTIWSLRKKNIDGENIPLVTIELNKKCAIVQAKGFENREPELDEMEIILTWEKEILSLRESDESLEIVENEILEMNFQ